MPKPLTRRERSIAAKYRRFLRAKQEGENAYGRADRIAFEIAKKIGGNISRISDLRGVKAINRIEEAIAKAESEQTMPKLWGHGAGRFFDLKDVPLDSSD